ncbi:MAG TPA: hypothetical protein VGC34_12145 [Steroidobacteraceae bacterium]
MEFVSRKPSAALTAQVILLNARRRREGEVFLLMHRDFAINLRLTAGSRRRLMVVIEGTELFCFHKPHELPGEQLDVRVPERGPALYFDQPGRHSLGVLILGDSGVPAALFDELDADEDSVRKSAVERVIEGAGKAGHEPVVVLRAEFEVVI